MNSPADIALRCILYGKPVYYRVDNTPAYLKSINYTRYLIYGIF